MTKRFSGQRIQLSRNQMRENGVCLLAHDVLTQPVDSIASLPKNHAVERTAGQVLCRQLAISNGLHTCDMTSMVNGFIWQGWLTSNQGKAVHDQFPDFNPSRQFTRRVIHGKEVLIAGREEAAIAGITGEQLFSATIVQGRLTQEQVTKLVINALGKDVVLNLGDGGHARLAVGFVRQSNETILRLANPYDPENFEELPIESALEFSEGNAITGIAKRAASMHYRD